MTPSQVVAAFNGAVERKDLAAVADLLTDDTVFESTGAPDGVTHRGREAVVAFWAAFFADNPDASFDIEEELVIGDRVVTRWSYRWTPSDHVRGVDLFKVSGDGIAEKLSYVKG